MQRTEGGGGLSIEGPENCMFERLVTLEASDPQGGIFHAQVRLVSQGGGCGNGYGGPGIKGKICRLTEMTKEFL